MSTYQPAALGPRAPVRPLSRAARAASLEGTLGARPPAPDGVGEEIWIFAYGSLIWRPAFPPAAALPARLTGYHRRFCTWTTLARGRPERPGLGLGLAPGGACRGLAQQIDPDTTRPALEALWAREMYTGVYRPRWVRLVGEAGRFPAIAFVADPDHPQYAGRLDPEVQAALIADAEGENGTCYDYLRNTVHGLRGYGIADRALDGLLASVERIRTGAG